MKKAGFVIGATAAGLLALSPAAFASEGDNGGDGIDKDSTSLVGGLNGNNAEVPLQACNNNANVLGVQGENLTAGLLGGTASDNSDGCGQGSHSGDNAN